MAINYGNYAQLYGQGVDLSPVQEAIQRFQEASKERMATDVQMIVNDTWNNAMKPFESALSGDINTLDTLNLQNQNAGKAFSKFQMDLRKKGDKYYREATRLGLLNPATFKQQYDEMFRTYVPKIENRLMTHMKMNNLSDNEMEEFINKSGLNSYLLQYGDDASPLKKLAQPERTWGQWYRQKGEALGLGSKAAQVGVVAGMGATGAGGVSRAMNRYERFKSDTGLSKKDMKALESAAKKTGFGNLAVERSEKVKSASIKKSKSALTKAQNKYSKAEKAYKGKNFATTKEGKNLKSAVNTAKSNLSSANKTPVKNVKGVLNRAIAVSYTHLTLPTICRV